MAITDAERHKLHTKLDQVLGEEDAAVLISHLPPSGWSDVVRTRDLDQFEARVEARFAMVDLRFEALESRLDARFAGIDARFAGVDLRFEALEARFDAKFDALDARFDAAESRFSAALERGMREQLSRFFLGMGAMLTIFTAVQALLN